MNRAEISPRAQVPALESTQYPAKAVTETLRAGEFDGLISATGEVLTGLAESLAGGSHAGTF